MLAVVEEDAKRFGHAPHPTGESITVPSTSVVTATRYTLARLATYAAIDTMSGVFKCNVAMLCASIVVGCYQSHDATDLPDGYAGEGDCRLRFYDARSGGDVECTVASSSSRACSVLAECVCRAWNPAAPEHEIAMCVLFETIPRGAITLADFCTESLPARMTLDEAARGYIRFLTPEGSLSTTEACASTPALVGR